AFGSSTGRGPARCARRCARRSPNTLSCARTSPRGRRKAAMARRSCICEALEEPAHLYTGAGEVATERGAVALDQPEVGELHRHGRVQLEVARKDPAQVAPTFRARLALTLATAEHADEQMEAALRDAADLVER